MTRMNRYPLYQSTSENAANMPESQEVTNQIEAPKDRNDLLGKTKDLDRQLKDLVKEKQDKIKNSQMEESDKAKLTADLKQIESYIAQLGRMRELLESNTPLAPGQFEGMSKMYLQFARGYISKQKDVNTQIQTIVNHTSKTTDQSETANKGAPEPSQNPLDAIGQFGQDVLKNVQTTFDNLTKPSEPAQTETQPQAPAAAPTESASEQPLKELKLPSEIFASIIRPLPRPANEAPLEKTQLAVELNKLDNAKEYELMMTISNEMRASIDSAIIQLAKQLTPGMDPAKAKEITDLSTQLTALSEKLLNGKVTTDKAEVSLFAGMLEALSTGEGYMEKAKQLLQRKAEVTSSETPEKKLKDLKDMTEQEKSEMLTALSYQLGDISKLSPEVGKKPAPLTAENVKKGIYVGDLFRTGSDRSRDQMEPTDFTQPNSFEQKTLEITGPNTFRYRDGTAIFTVERRSNEGISTRTKIIDAEITSFLSQLTRLPAAEKGKYLDPIIKSVQAQLDAKGEKGKVYLAIRTNGDKTGTLTIKQIPEKK